MPKIKVKIKDGSFPVRYNGERFSAGKELMLDEKHLNKTTMEVIETNKPNTSKTPNEKE